MRPNKLRVTIAARQIQLYSHRKLTTPGQPAPEQFVYPNLQRYYESIREIFEETVESQGRYDLLETLSFGSFLGALISLLPILPAVLYGLGTKTSILNRLHIGSWYPPIRSFGFWFASL